MKYVPILLSVGLYSGCATTSDGSDSTDEVESHDAIVTSEIYHDTSPPLKMIAPAERREQVEHEVKRLPRPRHTASATDEPAVMLSDTQVFDLSPTALANFDGIGNGVAGFSVTSAPPDTNGDVGPNHYVQLVNSDLAVYNKSTGALILGPEPTNTLWSGFGGLCQTDNDGDGVVLYDPIADRWVVSQFAVSGTTTAYLHCIAVSTGPNPTGTWNRYAFSYGNQFPDYPKMGVWPDAYYETFNMFNSAGTSFLGGKVCAYDRAKMLLGQAATQVCFSPTDAGQPAGGLLPADLDGARLPPAGSPNYVLALGNNSNQLAFYKFHVDFATPANSTLTGPTDINVGSFTEACGTSGTCIPQSGGGSLDSLGDRLMFRLAYRNLGDHESLVVNHSITGGGGAAVRWYELRVAGGTPSVFQQGTFVAPGTSTYTWMGSAAMDQSGNIAIGYSVSSSTLHPEIHYTGRLAADALGTMTQGDNTIINGAGSQGSSLSRWGDYSAMTVDPSDDCTFFFTSEYIPSNGTFNWRTRAGSFKLPGCGGVVTNDFSIAASPSNVSAVQGSSGTTTISTTVTSGTAENVVFSASGLPAGATAQFSPGNTNAGGSSVLTLTAGASTTPGNYNVVVTGTAPSATHSTTVSFTVNAPFDFSISANPTSVSANQGGSGTTTISTAVVSGSAGTVNLSASGLPTGATPSFNPASVTAGGSSILTLTAGASTPTGTYTVTVTGTSGATTHSTTVSFTVNPPPANDFTLNASPTSVSVLQGMSGTSSISAAITSGSSVTVNLSASGLPTGATASFNPTSVTSGGGASTLTLTAGASTPVGSYSVTVTGVSGSITHTTQVGFAVTMATGGGITNGNFETGSLSGWTTTGTATVTTSAHSGSYAASVGLLTTPTVGDSSIAQTFTVPAAGGTLSFWYKVQCPDTITYDWATATLKDNVTGTTTTVLAKTCTNTGAWVNALSGLAANAGHSVTLTLISHDDDYPGDGTAVQYDDVTILAAVANPVQNPGFENGLTSWTTAGSTASSTVAHSGAASARVGSTSSFNGDSSVSQTFTVPSGSTTLTFWYQVHCTDTVTYDWATATLKDNTTGTTATVLSKTCANSSTWSQKSASVIAGHSYTLTLIDHDDNYPGDPTYTLYDDVSVQ